MKKQILALAIAGALAVPQVGFAAEDDSGMQYTSASEGLFGSLRTRYNSGGKKGDNGKIEADGSVFGYRGSLDLGNGLTGTYHYEQRILAQEGETLDMAGKVRYNYVGLRGNFGSMEAGSFGSFVAGVPNVTDVTANGGGNFVPFYRTARGIQYTSPELNGFQAGGHFRMQGGKETAVAERAAHCSYANATAGMDPVIAVPGATTVRDLTTAVNRNDATQVQTIGSCPSANSPTGAANEDGTFVPYRAAEAEVPNVDQWAIAAKYKVRGFQVGGTYITDVEEYSKSEDAKTWFVSGTYSQDNWKVAAMHGQKNTSDNNKPEDESYISVSGNVTVGKVGLAVLHDIRNDTKGDAGKDTTVTALSATYNFTSRSRVWAAYIAQDDDTDADVEDYITIGMRMDF